MSNPFSEIRVKTVNIVIITPILYIIGININWIRFWPNVRACPLAFHKYLIYYIQLVVRRIDRNLTIVRFSKP